MQIHILTKFDIDLINSLARILFTDKIRSHNYTPSRVNSRIVNKTKYDQIKQTLNIMKQILTIQDPKKCKIDQLGRLN